jgi:DNA-binding MarR family transcriptional regulator
MSTSPHCSEEASANSPREVPIAALLRAARGSYGHAIRRELIAVGLDDLPPNGAYVVGGIVTHGGSAGDLVRQLGVSKQAASQLIDTLVVRGYLERRVDPEDRRRNMIEATDRGRAAADAIRTGVDAVNAELVGLISADGVKSLRDGLIALVDIRERMEEEARAFSVG